MASSLSSIDPVVDATIIKYNGSFVHNNINCSAIQSVHGASTAVFGQVSFLALFDILRFVTVMCLLTICTEEVKLFIDAEPGFMTRYEKCITTVQLPRVLNNEFMRHLINAKVLIEVLLLD